MEHSKTKTKKGIEMLWNGERVWLNKKGEIVNSFGEVVGKYDSLLRRIV